MAEVLDIETMFTDAFLEEVEKRKQRDNPTDPTEWRAGGRKSAKWPNKEDASWWLTEGPKLLQAWCDWWRQAKADGFTVWQTPTGLPAVELGLNPIIAGVPFKCYIDAVLVDPDGDLLAVDWKTGREPVAPIQLGAYKVALEKTFPGIEVRYGAYYLARKGDLSAPYKLSIYTESLLGDWLGKAKDIETRGDFIPHPSTLCSACGVRSHCLVMGGERAHELPQF